ncbi:FHA domain-containing protein [Glaciibacter superstes]|uniref:FHA domain-containing protein n=1 Tax=Glaciibacter superstes TaxID=501023 RepID=UPI0003B6599E|nr:FHA domain-containing protein [Glaciibacter superstes]
MLSYQHDESGEWLALAVPARLLLVKRPDAPDSASRLWNALCSENSAQAVLDELTSGGLFSAPPFALLTWDGELAADTPATLRAIVRGDVSVQLETTNGPESVTGRTISTWVEQTFGHVTGFEASTGSVAAKSSSLPLGEGAVRAAQVSSATVETATSKTATVKKAQVKTGKTDATAPLPQDASGTGTGTGTGMPAKTAPPTAPVRETPAPVGEETIVNLEPDEPGETDEQGDSVEPEFGSTVVRGTDRRPKPAAGSKQKDAAVGGPRIDLPAFITASGPVPATPGVPSAAAAPPTSPTASKPAAPTPTPTPPAQELPADSGSGDHDGMTVMSGDIQKLRNSRKHRPGSTPGRSSEAEALAPPAAAPTMYLLLPSGAREPLTQPILVGRSPSVTKVSGGQVPRLVSLGGADQDISRNHVQFQVEGDTVVVTDLHSRNGTLIVLPGKPPQKLRQGEPTSVIVGTVVDLGSGISLTVRED